MLVVVGCIIAGIGDLAFNAWAYAFAFSSVITQALYLLLVEFQASVSVLNTRHFESSIPSQQLTCRIQNGVHQPR
jgi:hypothetical protein